MTNLTATQPGRHRRPLGWMPSIFGLGLGHAGRRIFDTVTGDNHTTYVGRRRACSPHRAHLAPFLRLTGILVGLLLLMAALPAPARAATVDGCQRLLAEDYSDTVIDELVAAGWTGNPHDGVEALYAPTCAPDAADEWPMGAGVETVAYDLLPPVVDVAAEALWTFDYVAAGWTLLEPGTIVTPDGTDHGPCLALVGPTTTVQCADGYTTES